MGDQTELILQYRTTLEVMKEKLCNLREEKERHVQKLALTKSSSPAFNKLEQEIDILQEGVQAQSLEIFKEKGNLRKLKAETDWDNSDFVNSKEIQALKNDLNEALTKNSELKGLKNMGNSESKFSQLEQSNPKLFALVKKLIVFEETNVLLKEELSFLEQERNKIRQEYYIKTQALGQEEKIKLKLKENKKDIEKSEANCKFFQKWTEELAIQLEKDTSTAMQSENRALIERQEVLKQKRAGLVKIAEDLEDKVEQLEVEIEFERGTEKKGKTNYKNEIKQIEAEITETTKAIRAKELEKKRLIEINQARLKEIADNKRKRKSTVLANSSKSSKSLLSNSNSGYLNRDYNMKSTPNTSVGKQEISLSPQEAMKSLKQIRSQDMSLTARLIHSNRDDFLRKLKLSK